MTSIFHNSGSRTRCSLTASTLLMAASTASAQNAGTWTFVNLHPAGSQYSVAYGVDAGQQVGVVRTNNAYASMWTGASSPWINLLNPVDRPGEGGTSAALAVNNGQQVGIRVTDSSFYARLWTGSPGSWIDLNPAGSIQSLAMGVCNGQQVGSVAFQNNATGNFSRASMWFGTAASRMDLHPTGTTASQAWGTDGTQQVGYVRTLPGPIDHATVWTGTAASWVDLHPAGPVHSYAEGVHSGQQVGVAVFAPNHEGHAALWRGTSQSWVDLHPAGAVYSRAFAVYDGQQVGYVRFQGQAEHAVLWNGTRESRVDLHAILPPNYDSSEAHAITKDGRVTTIVGYGYNWRTSQMQALMWVYTAPCVADFNEDGSVASQDFFDFLAAFFTNSPAADLNNDSTVTSQDFFDFVAAFFEGC